MLSYSGPSDIHLFPFLSRFSIDKGPTIPSCLFFVNHFRETVNSFKKTRGSYKSLRTYLPTLNYYLFRSTSNIITLTIFIHLFH